MKRALDFTDTHVGGSCDLLDSRMMDGLLPVQNVDQSLYPNVRFPSEIELRRDGKDRWFCAICNSCGRSRFGRDHAATHSAQRRTVLNIAQSKLGRCLGASEQLAVWARHIAAQGKTAPCDVSHRICHSRANSSKCLTIHDASYSLPVSPCFRHPDDPAQA
jgi:hypothetical protein